MKRIRFIVPSVMTVLALLALALSVRAQQPAPQQAASRFDVTNYRIEAQIIPDQHVLRAGADVTFLPLDATRSVVFELNGSLKVESIEMNGKALTGWVQDAVGVGSHTRVQAGSRRVSHMGLSVSVFFFVVFSLCSQAELSFCRPAD